MSSAVERCAWAADPLFWEYHDREWGVPVHDDRRLFELLVLEGAQAGLSWATILRKRASYRAAFRDFDVAAISRFGERDVERLMKDPGIVRNRLKVESAIRNAKATLAVVEELGSLDALLWRLAGNETLQPARRKPGDVPARTAESDRMSRELKRRGFNFVGSTICYAFMQAVGMVNDHVAGCPRFTALGGRVRRAGS